MQITYDKEKATREKQEIDQKVAKPLRKFFYRLLRTVLLGLLLCGILAIFVFVPIDIPGTGFLHGTLIVILNFLSLFVATSLAVAIVVFTRAKPADELYSPATKYHAATALPDKKAIVEKAFVLHFDGKGDALIIYLALEDADHVVSKEGVCIPSRRGYFEARYRTDISDEICDLDKEIIWKPYARHDSDSPAQPV